MNTRIYNHGRGKVDGYRPCMVLMPIVAVAFAGLLLMPAAAQQAAPGQEIRNQQSQDARRDAATIRDMRDPSRDPRFAQDPIRQPSAARDPRFAQDPARLRDERFAQDPIRQPSAARDPRFARDPSQLRDEQFSRDQRGEPGDTYGYRDESREGFYLDRRTIVYPPPQARQPAADVYGYQGEGPASPGVQQRFREMGIENERFADPLADPYIDPGTQQSYGYLHGYDYSYDPGYGSQSSGGADYQFSFADGTRGYRRIAAEDSPFRARYGPGVYQDNAGFYGYAGNPQVYGYRDRQQYYYGPYAYQGDDPEPGDNRPLTTPQAYNPPDYYQNRPQTGDPYDPAFAARWPRELRPQPTPQLLPHERERMRENDRARLQRYQQQDRYAFREQPSWDEVDDYQHQWSDPAMRQRRQMMARTQRDQEVYGFDDQQSGVRDPRTQEERWRDEERMRWMRDEESRLEQQIDRRPQRDTYGYDGRPPTAAGGEPDDRYYTPDRGTLQQRQTYQRREYRELPQDQVRGDRFQQQQQFQQNGQLQQDDRFQQDQQGFQQSNRAQPQQPNGDVILRRQPTYREQQYESQGLPYGYQNGYRWQPRDQGTWRPNDPQRLQRQRLQQRQGSGTSPLRARPPRGTLGAPPQGDIDTSGTGSGNGTGNGNGTSGNGN